MGSDDDDTDAFRRAVEGARPLKNDRVHFERERPPARARFSRDRKNAVPDEASNSHPDPALPVAGEPLFYARPGLARATLKKLKRGQYALTAEIDLHGLTADQARAALAEFLAECAWHRHRCVRVITGKGKRSGEHGPVLRPRVARWLQRHEDVCAFTTARAGDGGSGALYVLLERA